MNNATINITTAAIDVIVQEYYGSYVSDLSLWSSTVLLLYVTLLKLGHEVEYIWSKSLSWPTLLYIFVRYGILFNSGFYIWWYYLPSSGRVCTLLDTFQGVFGIFWFIGIQGLWVARAYALIGKNSILTIVLVFMLLSGTVFAVTENILFDACSAITDGTQNLLFLLININIISTDVLVFAICIWKIWGVWKLGRQAGIRGSSSLASILVKQTILRCLFVIVINIALAIVGYQSPNSYIWFCMNLYQYALSSIMVAGFTLELRHQNSASIQANKISLSSIKFSNILENIQQSILVELSTPNPEEAQGPNMGDDIVDHDNIPATVSDIQSA